MICIMVVPTTAMQEYSIQAHTIMINAIQSNITKFDYAQIPPMTAGQFTDRWPTTLVALAMLP
jgi:hypothetical protein